jgi:hypothetical protein
LNPARWPRQLPFGVLAANLLGKIRLAELRMTAALRKQGVRFTLRGGPGFERSFTRFVCAFCRVIGAKWNDPGQVHAPIRYLEHGTVAK